MIALFLTLLVSFSQANEANSYAVPVQSIECKKLDFNSYFVAQNLQSNLKQLNQDVSKPNFAGHYLLMRSELLMEKLWLVADCQTGKFLHEKLSGSGIEFKADSTFVTLKKQNARDEHYSWSEDSWIKVADEKDEEAELAGPAPTTKPNAASTPVKAIKGEAAGKTLAAQYNDLFSRYPEKPLHLACKPIDYNSYFKAQSGQENIRKANPDVSKPNFAAKYILVKNELLFETLWYLVDCETGKFIPGFLSGNPSFRIDSSLVVLKQSGDFPELKLWQDQQWYNVVDPVQKNPSSVHNSLDGAKAKTLFDALPFERKNQKLSFETIQCLSPDNCNVHVHPDHDLKVDAKNAPALSELIRTFGNRIEEGNCSLKSSQPVCEVNFR